MNVLCSSIPILCTRLLIIPRANFLGATMYLPEGDKYSTQRKEALDLLRRDCQQDVSTRNSIARTFPMAPRATSSK